MFTIEVMSKSGQKNNIRFEDVKSYKLAPDQKTTEVTCTNGVQYNYALSPELFEDTLKICKFLNGYR